MLTFVVKKKIKLLLDLYLVIIGLFALIALIINNGFYLTLSELKTIWSIFDVIIATYIIQEFFRWFIIKDIVDYFKTRWIENLIAVLLLINLVFPSYFFVLSKHIFPGITPIQFASLYLSLIEIILVFVILVKALRYNYLLAKIKLHPGAVVAISFATMIFFGTMLLLLPKATQDSVHINFVDALFTSTSAICVTGLTVLDTATAYTLFGKTIIIFLIQIGGLGIMTLTTFFAAFFAGGLSFKVRVLMKDLLSQDNINEVRALLIKIIMFTLTIEFLGVVLLYLSLNGSLSNINLDYLFSSIFHSISAFCNAGFSIYSLNLMDSEIANNYFFPTIIMILIILGGIGFPVLSNLASYRPWKKIITKPNQNLSTYSKIVLTTTISLLIFGTIIIIMLEPFQFSKMNLFEKIFHSLFLAVTPRTAGFNTVPTELLAPATIVFIILLMWIGASPGSTGGGIKTTTFAITSVSFFYQIRGRYKTLLFKRRISDDSIHRASMVIFASLIALFVGSLILICLEPDKEPLDLIFEATSALGTVGLSRNITPHLGTGGKIIVIMLMYTGRIGILTFFLAFFRQSKDPRYSLPTESITVG